MAEPNNVVEFPAPTDEYEGTLEPLEWVCIECGNKTFKLFSDNTVRCGHCDVLSAAARCVFSPKPPSAV